jgi:hypothetical protein
VGLGTLAAMYASWRIAGRDLATTATSRRRAQVSAASFALVCGVAAMVLYVLMNAAD